MKALKNFFQKLADGSFSRDAEGHTIIYPMGVGRARRIPDPETEASLRRIVLRMQYLIFGVQVPLISIAQSVLGIRGWQFVAFFAICGVLGLANGVYLAWVTRDLPASPQRRNLFDAADNPTSRMSDRFIWFGIVTSALFTMVGIWMTTADRSSSFADPVAGVLCTLFFGVLTVLYVRDLRRRRQSRGR